MSATVARMFSLSYFSLLCPNKPLLKECLNDVINNVVQKRLSERYAIAVDSKYIIAVDTSPAQVVHKVEALHSDINSMSTAVYTEFQDWLQTLMFERLARAELACFHNEVYETLPSVDEQSAYRRGGINENYLRPGLRQPNTTLHSYNYPCVRIPVVW